MKMNLRGDVEQPFHPKKIDVGEASNGRPTE